MSNFGKNLKRIRKSRGMTQQELAEKTGLTNQVVSNFERSYTNPNEKQITQIASALHIRVGSLIDTQHTPDTMQALVYADKAEFNRLPIKQQQYILKTLNKQAKSLMRDKQKAT